MHFVRSIVFAVAFYAVTMAMSLLFLPGLLLPYPAVMSLKQIWLSVALWLVRNVVGITVRTRGEDSLPEGPYILAPKHQSAWDTMGLSILHKEAAFVLKRELIWVPVWGWYLIRTGMIPIDRARGIAALKRVSALARERIAQGRPVLIFPQGTRTPPGAKRPYLPGVAAIYAALGVPVVPVALNSGLFWPRRRFVKWPGTITVEYLEPIQPGLERKAFMRELESRIETATARIEEEARLRYPYLPAPSPPAGTRNAAAPGSEA